MNVMLLTWEFPPNKVGGIGSHCYDLSRELASMGHEVDVITYGEQESEEETDGVRVHRVPSTWAPDTISWAMFLGHRMEKKAIEINKERKIEVLHAHDWMTVPGAVGIKKMLGIPMAFTIHSTEAGRNGVYSEYSRMINDLEWYGTYEASEIITVGRDFSEEIKSRFHPPAEKVHYIPNGMDLKRYDEATRHTRRSDYAGDWEKIVFFAGRMVRQKGVEHLIDAVPNVLKEHGDTKFVLAGGGNLDEYRAIAAQRGVRDKTYFLGQVDEQMIFSLFKIADVSVAPSVYEPFGIVALESFAGETPMVASSVGGFKETVKHEWSGLHTYPANPQSISDQLNRVLSDEKWGDWMGRNGRKDTEENYRWDKIAAYTTGVYGRAMELW